MQAGHDAAAGVEARAHQRGGIARCGDGVSGDHQGRAPLRRERAGQGGAGDPRADDRHARRSRIGRRGAAEGRLQSLGLAAEARPAIDGEAGGLEAPAHRPRDGEGPGPRSGLGAGSHKVEHLLAPHLRIARGGEAVQEPGAGPAGPGLERFGRLHDRKVEAGAQAREVDAVETVRRRPAANQLGGEIGQSGPGLQRPRGVLSRQRKGLDREDVEPAASGSRAPPQVQQRQDVQPRAEAELADGEAGAPLPGPRQAAAGQEHGAGFLESAFL